MVRSIYTDMLGNPITFAQRRLRRLRHGSLPTLFLLIQNQSWQAVLRRAKQYPEEVTFQEEGTGNTPLHAACRLDPPPAVLRALQATCRVPNGQGATPLHVAACHRCSAEALQALLDCCYVYAQAATSTTAEDGKTSTSPTADLTRMGRAPMHYACMSFRGLDLEAFKLLLDATLKDGNVQVVQTLLNDSLHHHHHHHHHGTSLDELEEEFEVDFAELEGDSDYCQYEEEDDEKQENKEAYNDNDDDDDDDDETLDAPHEDDEDEVLEVNVMSLKDATGQTPLALLFRRYRERVRYVISRVERLRREHVSTPEQAALAAAMTVHADLGELWEKARWIVARLTEERIQREQLQQQQQQQQAAADDSKPAASVPGSEPTAAAATSASTSNMGTSQPKLPPQQQSQQQHYHHDYFSMPLSPGEAAVAQEAASWATEQQQHTIAAADAAMVHPSAVWENVLEAVSHNGSSTAGTAASSAASAEVSSLEGDAATASTPTSANSSSSTNDAQPSIKQLFMKGSGRKFRIVHASVGLTGYGCPPEMIRLAISIHPHQVMEMDEDGNLPLHIAATASSVLATADQASPLIVAAAAAAAAAEGAAASDDMSVFSDTMSFFSLATIQQATNPFDKVIKILLQHYPEAARIPQGKSGRLPLVMAIEAKRRTWEDGIRSLMHAYPPALHNKKVIEPVLYPHVLSLLTGGAPGRWNDRSRPDPWSSRSALLEEISLLRHAAPTPATATTTTTTAAAPPPADATTTTVAAPPVQTRLQKQRQRHEDCARTTMFDLLRTKPDWLSREGYEEKKKKKKRVVGVAARGWSSSSSWKTPRDSISVSTTTSSVQVKKMARWSSR